MPAGSRKRSRLEDHQPRICISRACALQALISSAGLGACGAYTFWRWQNAGPREDVRMRDSSKDFPPLFRECFPVAEERPRSRQDDEENPIPGGVP